MMEDERMKGKQQVFSLLFAFLLVLSSILTPIQALAEQQAENPENGLEEIDAEEETAVENQDEPDEQQVDKKEKEDNSEDKDQASEEELKDVEENDAVEEQTENEAVKETEEVSETKERAPPVTVNIRVETHEKTLVPPMELTVDSFDIMEYIDDNNGGKSVYPDEPMAIHAIIRALETVDGLDVKNQENFLPKRFGGNYIAQIGKDGEFTSGGNSGWMYFIDNGYVPVGVLDRPLNDGESIVLYYVIDYMDNTFSWFESESYTAKVGESLSLNLKGVNFNEVNPVEGATILIDEAPYTLDGEKILTDENGDIDVLFDTPGTYHLSADRTNQNGDRNIIRPYAEVIVSENDEPQEPQEPQEPGDTEDEDEEDTGEDKEDDTTAPVLTIEGMKDGETVTEETLTFSVTATDDVDDDIMPVITLSGKTIETDENGKYTVTLQAGENVFVIKATDKSGNTVTEEITVHYEKSEKVYDIKGAIDRTTEYILSRGVYSEWEAVGLARAGKEVPASYYDEFMEHVENQISETLPFGQTKITDIERLTIAAAAIGVDARDVNGHNFIDLLYNSPMRGIFDTMTFQGNNGPIFALIALNTHQFSEPANTKWNRQKLIAELLNNQKEDGSWSLSSSYAASSVDITAMAIIGLAPYKDQPEVTASIEGALDYLSSVQNDEGGFTEWFVGGTSSEATAQAIIGLTAYGLDPTSERFTKNGNNLVDHLLSYQNADGGFAHLLEYPASNGMATEQALQALVAYDYFIEDKGRLYEFGTEADLELRIAEKVKTQIEDLPDVAALTLSDKEKVQAARTAYQALTKSQQKLVDNITVLEAAEQQIAQLETELEKEKQAIEKVEKAIAALPSKGKVTLSDKNVVQQARVLFEALSAQQKKLVTNVDKLEKVEAKLTALEEKETADKKAAKAVETQIATLADVDAITLEDEQEINATRKAYDALTKDQKQFVTNEKTLVQAEEKIASLKKQLKEDKAAAKKIDGMIIALPNVDDVTLKDKDVIDQVRSDYTTLTSSQKDFVKQLNKLEKLEEKIVQLQKQDKADRAAAKQVDEMIMALPAVASLALTDGDDVKGARDAYEKLTKKQKGYVKQLALLTALEEKLPTLYIEFDETTGTITGYVGSDDRVTIPQTIDGVTVTAIGTNAFANKAIKEINLPNTIETIADGAFKENELTFVFIPASVSTIGEQAFYQNPLEKVEIDHFSGQVTIENDAFLGSDGEVSPIYLKVAVDRTALEEALEKAKAIEKGNYTDESFETLLQVIAKAEKALDNSDVTQIELDAFVQEITNAITNLVEKEATTDDGEEPTKKPQPVEKDDKQKEDHPSSDPKEKTPKQEEAQEKQDQTEQKKEEQTVGTTDGSNGNNNAPQASQTEKEDGANEQLPNTATQLYNNLLIGFVLIMFAGAIHLYRKQRSSKR